MRRTRNLTPWPIANPEQAQHYTIERTRTNAGQNTILAVIDVRIEQVRIDPYGEATGIVFTRVDGGEWINEGGYLLSRKVGGPATLAEMPLPDYEPLPTDWEAGHDEFALTKGMTNENFS